MASSSHSSKQSQTLNLTVKSEHKQQDNTNPKQQQSKHEKHIQNFRKHKLLPNGKEYYIPIIRELNANKFRVGILNENECWISQELLFEKVRNPSYSNARNFRNDLIAALDHPNHKNYEIEEIDCDKKGNPMSVGSDTSLISVIPIKELKVYRKASGLTMIMANIKCHKSKRSGSNLLYILDKMDKTLLDHKKKNYHLREDNKKYQERYNQSLVIVDEAISAKNNQEQELLAKFVLILNEKKKKIRALQSEILRLKQQRQPNNTNNRDNGNNYKELKSLSPLIVNDGNNGNNKRKKRGLIQMETDEEVKELRNDDNQNNNDQDEGDIDILDIDDGNNNKKKKKRKKKIERIDTDDVMEQIMEFEKIENKNDNNKDRMDVDTENIALDLSMVEIERDDIEQQSPSFAINKIEEKKKIKATGSRNMNKNKNKKRKNKNKSKKSNKMNVIDDGSLSIGDCNIDNNNKSKSKSIGKKRKRDVLNEKEVIFEVVVPPRNKKRKMTQKQSKEKKDNTNNSNNKRRISDSSDGSTVSHDFNTNSII